MKKYIIIAIVIGILGFFILQGSFQASTPFGGTMDINRFSEATDGVVGTTTASSSFTILSANSGRKYVRIANEGTPSVDINLGATATQGQGIRLDTGESYEITPLNLYVGAISGIASTTPSILFYIEE